MQIITFDRLFRISLKLSLLVIMVLIGDASTPAIADTVPFPWDDRDIGDVGQAGRASAFVDGNEFPRLSIFNVAGAGADIWGTADAFHYVSLNVLGRGWATTMTARVTSQQNTNPFAKAGLMIRTSYDASAGDVILDVRPNGTIEFMTRQQTGGMTTFVAGTSATLSAVWLRLVYDGQTATGSVSADGEVWTALGSISLSGGLYIGMAVTSHDPTVLNESIFENVQVGVNQVRGQVLPSGWEQHDVGVTGLVGTASYANGTFTVGGAGDDIWATSDSFTYVYDAVVSPPNYSGLDGTEIMAHVTSLQNADRFAKAGVMIREGLDPISRNVVLDVKPNGEVEFMARLGAGVPTTFVAGATAAPASAWLRLVLTSGVAVGYVSSDGRNWSKVGDIPISIPDNHYIGLAVTSHDPTVLNTVTFDNVLVGWSSQDIGQVDVPGRILVEDNRFVVDGAGSDIWGLADSFHFVYRPSSLAGTAQRHSISVGVDSLQNTSPFAKAGVMFRDSIDPTAAEVILDVKPDGVVEFMARDTTGAPTSYISGGTYPFMAAPVYSLLLVMDGATFSGYVCQAFDRLICSLVGTTSASISADGLVGLAVTSHDLQLNTTAVFTIPAIDGIFPR